MHILFSKYQATGNDFILLDNRDHRYDTVSKQQVASLCDRRFGIGGDGLMLLNLSPDHDFEMKYFNADGALGSMCGNGGRCITAFAQRRGITSSQYRFLAFDGEHLAKIRDHSVSLKMSPVHKIDYDSANMIINTGSPHFILNVENVAGVNVFEEGRTIRNSPKYMSEGINVNFVEKLDDQFLYVRTYERGVEDETFSCGTGVTAAAIASAGDQDGHYEFRIRTKGGELQVSFQKSGKGFDDIWLTGPAEFVFSGEINI